LKPVILLSPGQNAVLFRCILTWAPLSFGPLPIPPTFFPPQGKQSSSFRNFNFVLARLLHDPPLPALQYPPKQNQKKPFSPRAVGQHVYVLHSLRNGSDLTTGIDAYRTPILRISHLHLLARFYPYALTTPDHPTPPPPSPFSIPKKKLVFLVGLTSPPGNLFTPPPPARDLGVSFTRFPLLMQLFLLPCPSSLSFFLYVWHASFRAAFLVFLLQFFRPLVHPGYVLLMIDCVIFPFTLEAGFSFLACLALDPP